MKNYFENWRNKEIHKGNTFIRDGIVNVSQWEKGNKILFLLKEAYGYPDNDSIAEDINSWLTPKHQIWITVADWTFGLNHVKANLQIRPEYEVNEARGKVEWNEALKGISVVNIKKSGGKSRSDDKELDYYCKEDEVELKSQIDLINPSVIICGATLKHFKQLYKEREIKPIADLVYIDRSDNGKNRLIIDFCHPANQYPKKYTYYSLCTVYKAALDKLTLESH